MSRHTHGSKVILPLAEGWSVSCCTKRSKAIQPLEKERSALCSDNKTQEELYLHPLCSTADQDTVLRIHLPYRKELDNGSSNSSKNIAQREEYLRDTRMIKYNATSTFTRTFSIHLGEGSSRNNIAATDEYVQETGMI